LTSQIADNNAMRDIELSVSVVEHIEVKGTLYLSLSSNLKSQKMIYLPPLLE